MAEIGPLREALSQINVGGSGEEALRVFPLSLTFLCALCNLGRRGHKEKAEVFLKRLG